jgi:putative phosphoesterase
MKDSTMRVGLISDTHGLLRPQACAALAGSDVIVHAGDIGDASILTRLAAIAPVTAVRGNNDDGPWAAALRDTERIEVGRVGIFVIHDRNALAPDLATADVDVVVSGHSHRPGSEHRDGVLYVNPGSAGPRRFRLPVSVARLTIDGSHVDVEFVRLDVAAAKAEPRPQRLQAQR